jgi:hypothetical protein
MNRIDNNHATFINCLRDWNDPFLHGHGHSLKQQQLSKQYSCQRCESCACRINTSSAQTNLNDDSYTNNSSSQSSINTLNNHQHNHISQQRKYTKRRNSNEINTSDNVHFSHHYDKNHVFQPIVRCKSSVNVPKTIDQCIKLSKSRPRPSSIRVNPSVNNKSTHLTSLPPKKQQISTTLSKELNVNTANKKSKTNNFFEIELKDEEFSKIVLQSSPDTSTSNPSVFAQNTDSFKAFLAKNNQNAADIDLDDLIKINKPSSNLMIDDDLSHDLIDIEFIKETDENDNNDNNNNDKKSNGNDVNKKSDDIHLNLNKFLSASSTLSTTFSNKSTDLIIETNNKDTEMLVVDNEEPKNQEEEMSMISPIKIDENINENNQIINAVGSLLTSTSSLIENEEIVYEDSLQDESFDSDR